MSASCGLPLELCGFWVFPRCSVFYLMLLCFLLFFSSLLISHGALRPVAGGAWLAAVTAVLVSVRRLWLSLCHLLSSWP